MAPPRPLHLEPAHHLAPLPDGSWRMTGSDPQFLVRGPFARGVWEWRFRAAVRADTPEPSAQIYYAPSGEFSETSSVRFAPLPRTLGDHRLRFWLPQEAAVLRFDPADAPGVLVLGEVTARRHGRLAALARAIVREARRGGLRALTRWLRTIAKASFQGLTAVRRAVLDLIVTEGAPTDAAWVAAVVAERAPRYTARPEPGLLSILTTVYDTPAGYLRELADSVRAQSWAEYEWIVLDNGSTGRGTRRAVGQLAADPRVKLLRVDKNLGILGGMRYVLERASARYVLPVDSDDYLFPDALAIVASVIQRERYPALLYSDEDKLRDGRHVDPFLKPDWDPVLFRNCCYIAHLCGIERDEALRLGVYSDAAAEGCHDWDTFLRLSRAGNVPVHVPEILYSWRMHGGSTAANVDAKAYVLNSQRHVLERHLAESGLGDRFTVVRSPLFPVSPDWWIRRVRAAPPPIALVIHGQPSSDRSVRTLLSLTGDYPLARVLVSGPRPDTDLAVEWRPDSEPLLQILRHAAALAPLVVLADAGLVPATDEWLWEMAGLKESFVDAVLIGGRVLDGSGTIVSGAHVVAADGRIESRDAGRTKDDPGYFGTALKQRSTHLVSLRLAAVDAEWLRGLDALVLRNDDIEDLATALAGAAIRSGRRVIVSPFIEGLADSATTSEPSGNR